VRGVEQSGQGQPVSRADLDRAIGFRLSDEQWEVVSAPLDPAVVVAGAGSGKTTSMSVRIAWLVASGMARPDSVIGLTFTTKAAAQLLDSMRRDMRCLERAGLMPDFIGTFTDTDTGAAAADEGSRDAHGSLLAHDSKEAAQDFAEEAVGEPQVLTYNAFAARLLSEHGIRLGLEPGAQILGAGARQQLAYRVVCRTSLPIAGLGASPISLTSDVLALDDQLSELDIDPETVIDHDDALIAELDSHVSLQKIGASMRATAQARRVLALLVREWRAEKQSRDLLDFTDQTRLALEIVRRFPDVAASVRARHGVVLLDEYQDTSIAQRHLLQALFADGHPVTAVGDPCQAIYGWRGASVDNIEQFPKHFPVMRSGVAESSARYALTFNRRSGPSILDVANDLSRGLRSRHTGLGRLEAGDVGIKGSGDVRVGLFETAAAEKEWIVEQITGWRSRVESSFTDDQWSDIAILAATGKDLAEFDRLLRAAGVPTQLYGAAGLMRQPVVVELRSMLEILHNPIANPEMIRILAGPRLRLGLRDIAALGVRAAELAGGGHRFVTDDVEDALDEAVAGADPVEAVSLSDALFDLGNPGRFSPEALRRLAESADEIRELRRHVGEPMTELISRIGRVTGLDVECPLAAEAQQQQYAWSSFLDLAADFVDFDGTSSLGAFLSRLRDAERFDVELPLDLAVLGNAVQLMTIHKSKGLEFPHVFVPSVAKSAFPGAPARSEWPTSAATVPWSLRADTNDELDSFPSAQESPRDKDHKAYKAILAELKTADDERLAYVALTRAESTLIVTGHWWGPTQSTLRGPEPYLSAIRQTVLDGMGTIVAWHPKPDDGATNPSAGATEVEFPWPAPIESASAIAAVADRVRGAMADPRRDGLPAGLSASEQAMIEQWDADAELLLDEERRRRREQVIVPLPSSLSASSLIRALRDPVGLAVDLARPMPRRPAPAARRGTAFHAWVESRYGQQSLLDPDDLPGAGDEDIASDADLDALKATFEASVFAGRSPVAIEEPFALVLGGRVVRGRIDAVFERNGRYDVIDWKTGGSSGADPYQLAIYCIAWSQLRNVPLSDIDAGFFMVSTGELIRPDAMPDLAELARGLGRGKVPHLGIPSSI
jgi:DNA helicase-2/ATP-dependent DNA helicase PcrA